MIPNKWNDYLLNIYSKYTVNCKIKIGGQNDSERLV